MSRSIHDLPDEILEYILGLLSPYKDLESCKLVSRRWNQATKNVVQRKKSNFYRAIKSRNIVWHCVDTDTKPLLRHYQSACIVDGTMYIFGGWSCQNTCFNDIYTLDLTHRQFARLITSGQQPSPKAAASMCPYKNKLILYGGMANPTLSPTQPSPLFYDELHVFDITLKSWSRVSNSNSSKPCTAGHTATVHGNKMVVFSGVLAGPHMRLTGDLYYLNLDTLEWVYPKCVCTRPSQRAGHSQIYLDEFHLLILGGRELVNGEWTFHEDVWLLSMKEEPWTWMRVKVENSHWAPPMLNFRPVTRAGNCIVTLSRHPSAHSHDDFLYNENPRVAHMGQERVEENVNGRRGHFQNQLPILNPEPPAAHEGSGRLSARARREIQLEAIAKYKQRLSKEAEVKPKMRCEGPRMNLYFADLSDIVNKQILTWQQPHLNPDSPVDRVHYSLLTGNSEFIMLGGKSTADVPRFDFTQHVPQQLIFGVAPTLHY